MNYAFTIIENPFHRRCLYCTGPGCRMYVHNGHNAGYPFARPFRCAHNRINDHSDKSTDNVTDADYYRPAPFVTDINILSLYKPVSLPAGFDAYTLPGYDHFNRFGNYQRPVVLFSAPGISFMACCVVPTPLRESLHFPSAWLYSRT